MDLADLLNGAGLPPILIPRKDFIKEHTQLIRRLKTKKGLAKELKDQSEELAKVKGGRAGVSKASGFIQRLMAENKKKHTGDYKNPTYPLAPGSTMKKPAEFKWKELASADQGGTNESAYGASPFILSKFAGKPKMKETAKQRAARLRKAPPEVAEAQPPPPSSPPPSPPKASAKAETILDKIRSRLSNYPYLTHKAGTIWELTDQEQENGFGEFDIGCDPKKFKLDSVSGYYYIPIVEGSVLDKDGEVVREEDKLLLYFTSTPEGKPLGNLADGGRTFSWDISDNPPGGFTGEGSDELFSPETFMDDVWIPYQTAKEGLPDSYSGLPSLSIGVGDTIWSAWTS